MCARRTPVRAARTGQASPRGPRSRSRRSTAPRRPTDPPVPLRCAEGSRWWRGRRRRACLADRRARRPSELRPETRAGRGRSRPRERSSLQEPRPSESPGRGRPQWERHRPEPWPRRRSEPGSSRPGGAPARARAAPRADDDDNEHVASRPRRGAPGSTRHMRPLPHAPHPGPERRHPGPGRARRPRVVKNPRARGPRSTSIRSEASTAVVSHMLPRPRTAMPLSAGSRAGRCRHRRRRPRSPEEPQDRRPSAAAPAPSRRSRRTHPHRPACLLRRGPRPH